MMTGCVMLIAGGMLCFTGDKITCADTTMQLGVKTCRAQQQEFDAQMEWCKRNGYTSQDGSTSSCIPPIYSTTGKLR